MEILRAGRVQRECVTLTRRKFLLAALLAPVGASLLPNANVKEASAQVITTPTPTPTGTPLSEPSPLLLRWRLDEEEAELVIDSSGYNRKTHSQRTFPAPGRVGSSRRFGEGVSDTQARWVKVSEQPGGNGLTDMNQVTVAVWVNPEGSFPQRSTIVSNQFNDVFTWGYLLQWEKSLEGLFFNVNITGTSFDCQSTPGSVLEKRWTHVALSYNGSSRMMRLYVDGVLNSDCTHPTGGPIRAMSNTFYAGYRQTGNAWQISKEYFSGRMDEIRVYNKELTGAEIATLYQQEGSLATPTATATSSVTIGSQGVRQERYPDKCQPQKADLTGPNGKKDGVVNIFDFSWLARYFGRRAPEGDIDGDGAVTIFDFSCLSRFFNRVVR